MHAYSFCCCYNFYIYPAPSKIRTYITILNSKCITTLSRCRLPTGSQSDKVNVIQNLILLLKIFSSLGSNISGSAGQPEIPKGRNKEKGKFGGMVIFYSVYFFLSSLSVSFSPSLSSNLKDILYTTAISRDATNCCQCLNSSKLHQKILRHWARALSPSL